MKKNLVKLLYISYFFLVCCLFGCTNYSKEIEQKRKESFRIATYLSSEFGLVETATSKEYLTYLQDRLALGITNLNPSNSCLENLKISILDTNKLLALTTQNEIFLSKGMLSALYSEDELSFILAHEMSHIHLCHPIKKDSQREKELEADVIAVRAMRHAGYNPSAALSALTHTYATFAKKDLSIYDEHASHPMLEERIKKISEVLRHERVPRGRITRREFAIFKDSIQNS